MNIIIKCCIIISILVVCNRWSNAQFVPDISPDPYVFESERLPRNIDGSVNLRYMPGVNNGHIATNVYSDAIYMNGLYTGYRGWSYRARIPNKHAMDVYIDGVEDATQRYRLDIRRGLFEEEIQGTSANVIYRTYAHHFYNRILVTEIEILRNEGALNNITVSFNSLTNGTTSDINFDEPEIYNDTYRYSCGEIAEAETETSGLTPVCIYWSILPESWLLPEGQESLREVYLISVDFNDTIAKENLDVAAILTPEDLLQVHSDAWEDVWNNGSIELEGPDLTLQKVVYGSFYYLYSNLPSAETFSENNLFYGLSPGGLSNGRNGSDYYGHVFWDMETWMYPAILYFRPDLAKEMLSYRIHGMDPAFERAASGGYNGTRFPWESAYTGVEVTPNICPACRDNQQHITGDIAFAARQYVSATRDTEWLRSIQADTEYSGFNFIHEMARFWYTRPSYNITKDRYEIKGVMPPDEYQEEIDNSIYTNLMACLSIHFAQYAACLAGENPADVVPDSWIDVAENLVFLYNEEKRYHEEYEGYDENNQTSPQEIKQADVILLGFPLLWDMPSDVRQTDLEEYEKVTDPNGPAMTWGMHAVGWLELGNKDRAENLFNRSYQSYYREPFKIWTETQTGVGAVNFITGMGGFLQALISGYGGLRLHVEELHFKMPELPPGVEAITMRNLKYLGNSFTVRYFNGFTSFGLNEAGLELTMMFTNNATLIPEEGLQYTFESEEFKLFSTEKSGCELPKDTINVDYDPV